MKARILLPFLAVSSLALCTGLKAEVSFVQGKLNHMEKHVKDFKNINTIFDQILRDYPNIVLDFYASWCTPCQRMLPILESTASAFSNIIFVKVNIGLFKSLSDRYGVQSIPTLLYFKDGSLIKRTVGTKSKADLSNLLNTLYN